MKIAIIVVIVIAVLYFIGAKEEKKEKAEQKSQDRKPKTGDFDLNTPEYWSRYTGDVLAETNEGTYADAETMHKNDFAKYIAVAASMSREDHLDGLTELQVYLLPYRIVWLMKDEKGIWSRVENSFNDFKQGFYDCPVFEDLSYEDIISEFLRSTNRNGISALGVMLKKSLLQNERLVLQTDAILPYCTLRVKVRPAATSEEPSNTQPTPNQTLAAEDPRTALEAQMRALLKEKSGEKKD